MSESTRPFTARSILVLTSAIILGFGVTILANRLFGPGSVERRLSYLFAGLTMLGTALIVTLFAVRRRKSPHS